VNGSPSYMAPESLHSSPIDARADIFSLGVVSYELLTQRRPFESDSIISTGMQICSVGGGRRVTFTPAFRSY